MQIFKNAVILVYLLVVDTSLGTLHFEYIVD